MSQKFLQEYVNQMKTNADWNNNAMQSTRELVLNKLETKPLERAFAKDVTYIHFRMYLPTYKCVPMSEATLMWIGFERNAST